MGISNPQSLSKKEYNEAYAAYLFLRKMDREFELGILKQAISEALNGTQQEPWATNQLTGI